MIVKEPSVRLEFTTCNNRSALSQVWAYYTIPRLTRVSLYGFNNRKDYVSACYLSFNHTQPTASLWAVATASSHRRKGYSETLIRVLLELADQVGVEEVYLGVDGGRRNVAAWSLYEKLGFIPRDPRLPGSMKRLNPTLP